MKEPLAQRLRPRTLDEVCGQRHLLAPGQVFRRTIDRGVIPNMIFYGPSGVGKTTVASIIAANSGMRLYKLNGTTASTSDIKSVLGDIGTLNAANGILLYLDEIQYFNKRQQQSLLECVEQGTVTLIASTTENPYFYVYNALLSRCTVFEFKALPAAAIRKVVGPEVHIVDSAATTAEVVKRRLADEGLAHPQAGRTGRIRFFITDDPQRFTRTGSLFLNMTITDSDVRLVDLENVPLPDAAETPTQRKPA